MTSKLPAHSPPFRAEHIGSLLRPPELRQAFRAFFEGALDAAGFAAAQDRAIRDCVALQEKLGFAVITDGEFRRVSYWAHFLDAVEGFAVRPARFAFHDEHGATQPFQAAHAAGKLQRKRGISTAEYAFLAKIAQRATPKITLPSPSTFHFWQSPSAVTEAGYADREAFFADLIAIYRDEIADLARLGCRYVQLDEVAIVMLADPDIRTAIARDGEDADELLGLYIDAINRAVTPRPAGMRVGMHICRGNFKGKFLAESGYDAIAERLFADVAVDHVLLEYDTPRAGGFAPLRFVPRDKGVVLGLVSTKTPLLEDRSALARRVAEAARFVDLDRLAVSPQCGFASTVAGNPLSLADEEAKLRLVVELARELWPAGGG
jgi:5-methyltetrahydropteroyltriglutamate--homocysteine methyltransferase